MREQDVERIAAEVLAALRKGAPAGADRPAGRGDTGGAGLVPPAGRGGQPEAAHTGMPTAQDEGRDGDGTLPDLAGPEFRRGCFIASPHRRDVIDDFVSHTGARIATGTVGTRPPTRACLRFLADHARSKGTVFKEVPEEWISGHGLWSVSTLAEDKDTYLTRPDLGRLLSEESLRELKRRYADAPQVVIVLSDGLSTDALLANYEEILPPLLNGLKQAGIRAGAPLFPRHGRVKAEPYRGGRAATWWSCSWARGQGLGQSESMSCYAVYRPRRHARIRPLGAEHPQGRTPPVEAAADCDLSGTCRIEASGIKPEQGVVAGDAGA
ncbi:MAG: ethanolamine ammonia-lyase light chain EutC [Bilophila wadsworthia]